MKKTLTTVTLTFLLATSAYAQMPGYDRDGNVSGTQRGKMMNASGTMMSSSTREMMKEQFMKIKDARKRDVVTRIDDRLKELNKKLTDHFIALLGHLENVLKRITSRTDKAAAKGLDVTTVRQAITDAEKAIADARTAVQAQAGKTYGITVSTDTKLRGDVKKIRDMIHGDLTKVRDLVKDAYKAVQKTAVTLAQIRGVDDKTSTSTSVSSTEH